MRANIDTKRIGVTRSVLAATAGVIALWAAAGAIGLITGVTVLGAAVDRRLPFHSPVFAGLMLALVVAVPMALTTAGSARGHRLAHVFALASGALLVGWIVVQPAIIGRFFWLQPVSAVLGLLVIALGLMLQPGRNR